MTRTPRGIRLNNPGNIRKSSIKWDGLCKDQSGDDEFAQFQTPVWGIRAMCKVLLTYQKKHGLKTIRAMISRWAPPFENDTESYIDHVASKVGVGPDDEITLGNETPEQELQFAALVETIMVHENGHPPYFDQDTKDQPFGTSDILAGIGKAV